MVDLDPIPLAETDDENTSPDPSIAQTFGTVARQTPVAPLPSTPWIARGLIVILCSLHGLAIWWGLGGRAGLNSGWPPWRDDHPLYYHSALVTRSFLKNSWTTAGYDPSFMAGYAKSVVFPSSSTLPELVVTFFGGDRPEFAYKLYVLISAAAVPWLVALACFVWRVPAAGTAIAVFLDLLYVWTDFPINYVAWGMLPYFVAIPVGLVATGAFARFLTKRRNDPMASRRVLVEPGFSMPSDGGHGDRPRGGSRLRQHGDASPWCPLHRRSTASGGDLRAVPSPDRLDG